MRLAKERLGGLGVPIGAGSNAYFTEFNRERPPVAELDCVSYSLKPQVDAFDDASLAETLYAQGLTVESARRFCPGLPLCVSPVTLAPRFNPNATGPELEPLVSKTANPPSQSTYPAGMQRQDSASPGALPSQVDVRQMSLFGAGWTAISVKYLALSGLASATYYETSGWRGVMERATGSPLPDLFQSISGAVFPLYHVLADVGEFAGGWVLPLGTSDALRVDGLALEHGGRRRLLVVNLTGEKEKVRIDGLQGPTRVKQLDEENVAGAMREPEAFREELGAVVEGEAIALELLPYAMARIDMEEGNG